jgi:hypothetical protein
MYRKVHNMQTAGDTACTCTEAVVLLCLVPLISQCDGADMLAPDGLSATLQQRKETVWGAFAAVALQRQSAEGEIAVCLQTIENWVAGAVGMSAPSSARSLVV